MSLAIGGLAIGGVYALLGLGVVVIFRATGIVNFAQGQLMMVGAYAYVLAAGRTESAVLQLLAVLAAGLVVGAISYFLAHVLLKRAAELVIVLGTFGLGLLLEALARLAFTDTPKSAPAWAFGDRNVHVSGAVISANSLLAVGLAVVLTLALGAWFRYSLAGKSMEAVAEDQVTASLTGIHVRRVLMGSWALSGALAAIGGLLIAPITGAYPGMGTSVLLPAFFVVVIGGLESISGALFGGFALGLLQTYSVVAVGGAFRDAVIFVVLLLVLLLRPRGVFGGLALRRV